MFRSSSSSYPFQTPVYYPALNKLPAAVHKEKNYKEKNSIQVDKNLNQNQNQNQDQDQDQDKNSIINQLTMDLMVNQNYLAKTHPERVKQRKELHEKILKYKKEIKNTIQECFRHLQEGDIEPIGQNHLMNEFVNFAKLVIEDIEYSQLPEADELFS